MKFISHNEIYIPCHAEPFELPEGYVATRFPNYIQIHHTVLSGIDHEFYSECLIFPYDLQTDSWWKEQIQAAIDKLEKKLKAHVKAWKDLRGTEFKDKNGITSI